MAINSFDCLSLPWEGNTYFNPQPKKNDLLLIATATIALLATGVATYYACSNFRTSLDLKNAQLDLKNAQFDAEKTKNDLLKKISFHENKNILTQITIELLQQQIKIHEETIIELLSNKESADTKSNPYPSSRINILDPKKDLVHKAKEGLLTPIAARSREIDELLIQLLKKDKPNALLVGDPGVGKTAIVEGLAQKIAKGDVPDAFKNVKILMLTTSDFTAGNTLFGQFEERVNQFIKDLESSKEEIIVFIDESHTLMGGGHSNTNTLPNMLKPSLARGTIRMIGCTTNEELKIIQEDKAFMRRLGIIHINEPTGDALKEILLKKIEQYEKHHHCKYSPEAIETAISLAEVLPGCNPDKTLGILDIVGSKHQLSGISTEISKSDVLESFWG